MPTCNTRQARPAPLVAAAAVGALVALAASRASGQEVVANFAEQAFGEAFLADGIARDVAVLGDLDRDGIHDFALGFPLADTGAGTNAGRVVVLSGADRSVLWSFEGGSPGDNFGLAVAAAGDVDADGTPDLIVGAPHGPLPVQGYAQVFSGADGSLLWTLDQPPEIDSEHFGEYVAGNADLDADGHADLVVLQVDSPSSSGPSAVCAFSGADGALLYSISSAFLFGIGFVSTLGDINADGHDEFMFRSQGEGGGNLWVVSGADATLLQVFEHVTGRDVGDRDGDGVPDLFLSDGRLISGATWATLMDLPGFGDPHGVGDVDGDGVADLAQGPLVCSGVDGTPLFTAAHASSLIDLGDASGDGLPDLVGLSFAVQAGEAHSPAVLLWSGPAWVEDVAHGAQAGAASGRQVAIVDDANWDGYHDVLVGAPLDDTAGPDAGSVILLSGADGSTLLSLSGAVPGARFGAALAAAGDVDGDGTPDFVVGAPTEAGIGAVRTFSGVDGHLLFLATGIVAGGRFGAAVAAASDVNGDGFADVVVGAPQEPSALQQSGGVWLLAGPDGTPRFHVVSGDLSTTLGRSVASAGDVDGDGVGDVAAGAPGNDPGQIGSVQILSGVDGTLISTVSGLPTERNLGERLAAVGDVDGDGSIDLAIGTRWREFLNEDRDRVLVVSGADGSRRFTWSFEPGPPEGVPAVGAAGDFDSDGTPDVIVGWRDDDGVGFVEVRSGATGATLLTQAGVAEDDLGAAIGGGGDVNGDGLDDVVMGIPGSDAAGDDAGLARVVGFAPVLAPWTFLGKGLAGAQGLPVLLGAGELVPDGAVTLSLTGAQPASRNAFVLGLSAVHLPFKGGTLVPAPDVVLWPPLTGATGAWELVAHWPAGLPAATSLWFQVWVIDPSGPQGFAASNALLGVTPP